MEVIELKTLVDITNTNVRRPTQGTEQEHNQYKNWITLNQCIGMRSIITYDDNPKVEIIDINGLEFGTEYKGQHQTWSWRFYTDRSGVFANEYGNLALLINDLDQVPIIVNLTETINTRRPVFELTDKKLINTKLKIISGT
jgi:hypothetical protein